VLTVGIVGASGYTGGETLRILLRHPGVRVTQATSESNAGHFVHTIHPNLRKACSLKFIRLADLAPCDVLFLCLPHGTAMRRIRDLETMGKVIIDLSADFRLRDAAVYAEFYDHAHPAPELLSEAVYALPELRAEEITKARLIACPGCYPTSILVPLVPLLRAGLLSDAPIAVSSMSGVSGAGRKESIPFLFCECNESVRSYSVPKHRHLSEIGQELDLAAGRRVRFSFVPHLIPVNQGICTTIFASLRDGASLDDVAGAYATAYAGKSFVRLLGRNQSPDTKNVTGTNFVDVGWAFDERARQLILMSAEDNLVKGASGQAVQNFNLAHGFAETAGLMVI
jgi:N-acetyl-gamma-glutamyl-phosphate reductase